MIQNNLTDLLPEKQSGIAKKILSGQRISPEECLCLYEDFETGSLAILADRVRKKINGNYIYFNRNIHLEPTNICIHNCLFCSYSRKTGEEGAWEHSLDEIKKILQQHKYEEISEIHIVGGVHPQRTVNYYAELIGLVRAEFPDIHIKAFTAAEIEHMARKAGLSIDSALSKLKDSGLNSLPGGGAEIFDEKLRKKICPDKTSSSNWLKIHEIAHHLNIPSNCTMLYGHMENFTQRVDHLDRLRKLQDKTGGFNAFIPLKYKSGNNKLQELGEISPVQDLRNFAVSRIFLDNIPHLKAYWPMIGKDLAAVSLAFGVDDLDGTIQDTTRIYSMAGAEDQNPSMSIPEIKDLAKRNSRILVERDSLYNVLKIFDT